MVFSTHWPAAVASSPVSSKNTYKLLTSTSSIYGTPTAGDASTCATEFIVTDGADDSAVQALSIDLHAGVVMTPASSYGTDYFMGFAGVGSVGIAQSFTLTNNESVPVTALSVTSPSGGSDFAFEGGTYPGTGGTCGATLAPAQTCTVVMRFDPTIVGSVAEEIAIHFTAARGPVSYGFTLGGQGT